MQHVRAFIYVYLHIYVSLSTYTYTYTNIYTLSSKSTYIEEPLVAAAVQGDWKRPAAPEYAVHHGSDFVKIRTDGCVTNPLIRHTTAFVTLEQ